MTAAASVGESHGSGVGGVYDLLGATGQLLDLCELLGTLAAAAASVGEGQRCLVGCVCVVLGATVEPLELWGLAWRRWKVEGRSL